MLMSLARFGSGVERIASMIREHQEHQSASLLEFLKHYSDLTRSLPATLPGFQPPGKGHGGSVKRSSKETAKSPAASPTGGVDVDDAEATQIMMAELRYFHERLVHDIQVCVCLLCGWRRYVQLIAHAPLPTPRMHSPHPTLTPLTPPHSLTHSLTRPSQPTHAKPLIRSFALTHSLTRLV
jgi:hypothetical protein